MVWICVFGVFLFHYSSSFVSALASACCWWSILAHKQHRAHIKYATEIRRRSFILPHVHRAMPHHVNATRCVPDLPKRRCVCMCACAVCMLLSASNLEWIKRGHVHSQRSEMEMRSLENRTRQRCALQRARDEVVLLRQEHHVASGRWTKIEWITEWHGKYKPEVDYGKKRERERMRDWVRVECRPRNDREPEIERVNERTSERVWEKKKIKINTQMLSKSTYCRFAFSYYENKAHGNDNGNGRVCVCARCEAKRRDVNAEETKQPWQAVATSTDGAWNTWKTQKWNLQRREGKTGDPSWCTGKVCGADEQKKRNMNKNGVRIGGGIAFESGGNGEADRTPVASRVHRWSAQCAILHGKLLIPRLNNNNNNNGRKSRRKRKWNRRRCTRWTRQRDPNGCQRKSNWEIRAEYACERESVRRSLGRITSPIVAKM